MGSGEIISLEFLGDGKLAAGGLDLLMATHGSYNITIRNCQGKLIERTQNPNSYQPKVWSFSKDLKTPKLKISVQDEMGLEPLREIELDECDQDIWKRPVTRLIIGNTDTATDKFRAMGENKIDDSFVYHIYSVTIIINRCKCNHINFERNTHPPPPPTKYFSSLQSWSVYS